VNQRPLVCVVLPCFDAERFLRSALESVLGQTFRNLEVVAVDDGSTDSTAAILAEFAERDPRVRVLKQDANQGLISAVNRGIAEARGEFIARMDADDICAPDRIERQVHALQARPDVDVVGTAVRFVGEDGQRIRPRPVRCIEPGAAEFMTLLATPIVHPTLFARAAIMRTHRYGGSPDSLHTEDYELLSRMVQAGVRLMNLREPLVTVRARPGGVSLHHEQTQIANFVSCARRHLERTLGLRPDAAAHRVLVNRMDENLTARDLSKGLELLAGVERLFLARAPESEAEIRGIADEQRVDILVQAALKGPRAVRFAATLLALRYGQHLLSSRGRRYLVGKVRRSPPGETDAVHVQR
jgi:glycosyltransferase involved in cell wall biosynthesis